MAGIAVVLPDADFSALGLGKVTFVNDTPVTGINVSATKIEDNKYQLIASYVPPTTAQKGCTFEIVSGSEYASLNGNMLGILPAAGDSAVVKVRATSTIDPSVVSAVTDIEVEYTDKAQWYIGISDEEFNSFGLDSNNLPEKKWPTSQNMYAGKAINVLSGKTITAIKVRAARESNTTINLGIVKIGDSSSYNWLLTDIPVGIGECKTIQLTTPITIEDGYALCFTSNNVYAMFCIETDKVDMAHDANPAYRNTNVAPFDVKFY